jgi:hypothetical protein
MSVFSRIDVKNEFLNFLRNSDVFSTTIRGVTTTTDTDTASITGDETITLSHSNVKNIRSVTYDGALINYGSDYIYDIDAGTVTIYSVTLGEAYSIEYDYGTGDKIYPDYPRPDLDLNSYPRIGFDIYGQNSEKAGFGNVNKIKFRFMINIYASSNYLCESYMTTLRTKVIDAQTILYNISYMYPLNEIEPQPIDAKNKNNKIYMCTFDVQVDNLYEIN